MTAWKDELSRMSPAPRARLWYGLATIAIVPVGLSTRLVKRQAPELGDPLGDGLWAAMVFLGVSCLWPRWSTRSRAAVAVAFSFVVEFSQIYHRPWIDETRATRLGALVLGSDFSWPDLCWYALGVAGIAAIDMALRRQATEPRD